MGLFKDRRLILLVGILFSICIVIVLGIFVYHPVSSLGHSTNNSTLEHIVNNNSSMMNMSNTGYMAVFGNNSTSSLSPPYNNSYNLLMDSFPMFSGTIMAYKTVTPVVTKEYVQGLGSTFGFSPGTEPVLSDFSDIFGTLCANQSYTLRSTGDMGMERYSRELCVYFPSGAIMYVNYDLSNVQPTSLPDTVASKKIAEDFLDKNGLMPSDAIFNSVSPGQSSFMNTSVMIVLYDRKINGLPVVSAGYPKGNQLEIDLGNNGEIAQFYETWREVQPYKKVSIKTPQKAYDDLQNGKDVLTETYLWESLCGMTGYGTANITDISLGYLMQPSEQEQEYVMPVYIFKGNITGPDFNGKNTTIQYTAYVNATTGGKMP